MQLSSQEVRQLTLRSLDSIQRGRQLVDKSGESLSQIVEGIQQVSQLVEDIANACSDQKAGIDQVNSAVTHIEQTVLQSASLADTTARQSVMMNNQTQRLSETVSFFKIALQQGVDSQAAMVRSRRDWHRNSHSPADYSVIHDSSEVAA